MNDLPVKPLQTSSEELNNARRYATPGGKQIVDICKKDLLEESEFRGAMKYNLFKYLSRYKRKGGVLDLKKARQFLDYLIDFEAEIEDCENQLKGYAAQ